MIFFPLYIFESIPKRNIISSGNENLPLNELKEHNGKLGRSSHVVIESVHFPLYSSYAQRKIPPRMKQKKNNPETAVLYRIVISETSRHGNR